MGDAPSRYSATAGRGSYLVLVALANLRREAGRRRRGGRAAGPLPRRVPAVRRRRRPVRRRAARGRRRAAGDARRGRGARRRSSTASARFLLGTALYEAAHAAEAEEQFRAVVAAQPQNAGARVALAEALLSQRRWDEAAEAAAGVADGAAFADAARRTELFARIVAGDAAAAATAASRAAADLAPAELAGYDAWRRLAAGEPPLPGPGRRRPGPRRRLRGAPARRRSSTPSSPSSQAIERSALPVRSRREILANVYLRRGFLESAFEEWMTVCNEGTGPDADAFVGLAQVAWGMGERDDAVVFAREAATLDPPIPRAAGLAERMEAAALASSSV